MLQSMRSSISSWFVKALLTLIIASFIISYGFQGSETFDQGVVARVNGHEITDRDLSIRFQSRIAQLRSFFQKDIPEPLIRTLQGEVYNQLINEQLHARAAKKMGMTPSESAVKESIKKQFSDETGAFDFDLYEKTVRSYLGKSPGTYEKGESSRLIAEDFQNLITRTAWVSQAELKQKYEVNGTKLSLSYIKLDAEKLKNKLSIPSTDQDLEAYYKTYEKKFETPEKNSYSISWVSMDDMIRPETKDLEKTLRDSLPNSEKGKGLRIHAAHILLKTTPENEAMQRKKMESLRQKIASGENFETLAALNSEDGSKQQGGDLGYFGPGDMVPEFEKAASLLKANQVSGLVKSSFGYHIIKVYDKIEPGAASVDRLKKELTYLWKKKYFENSKKVDRLTKQAETVLQTYKKSPQSSSGVASIQTPLLSKEDTISGLPLARDSQLLLSSASNLQIGEYGNPVRSLGVRHVYLVKKLENRPAQTQPFEKVRDQVKQSFEKEKQSQALKTFAAEALNKAVTSKGDIVSLAKSLGLAVQKMEPFTKQPDGKIGTLGIQSALSNKLFAAQQTPWLLPEVADISGQLYFIEVTGKTSPDWEKFESEKSRLRTYASEEASRKKMEAWSTYLRSKAKVEQKGI